jgi:hypothetical protein
VRDRYLSANETLLIFFRYAILLVKQQAETSRALTREKEGFYEYLVLSTWKVIVTVSTDIAALLRNVYTGFRLCTLAYNYTKDTRLPFQLPSHCISRHRDSAESIWFPKKRGKIRERSPLVCGNGNLHCSFDSLHHVFSQFRARLFRLFHTEKSDA